MADPGYKPGLLIDLLGITREQFRYWRAELDPVPSRPRFSFPIIVSYGVVKELVVERWLEPRRLKAIDLAQFFHWFEDPANNELLHDAVICLDKHKKAVKFVEHRDFSPIKHAANPNIEVIFIEPIETALWRRFRERHLIGDSDR